MSTNAEGNENVSENEAERREIPYRDVEEVTLHEDDAVTLKAYRIEGYDVNFDIGKIIKRSNEVDIVEFHSKNGKSVTVCTDILKE